MKRLIQIAVAALIIHAMWRTVPVYWTYVNFRDDVRETARFAGARREAQILDRVMEIAAERKVPVAREAVEVRQTADHTYIDLAYVERLEILPRYFYPWEFKVNVDTWHVQVPEHVR
jgi:hypothetical protein